MLGAWVEHSGSFAMLLISQAQLNSYSPDALFVIDPMALFRCMGDGIVSRIRRCVLSFFRLTKNNPAAYRRRQISGRWIEHIHAKDLAGIFALPRQCGFYRPMNSERALFFAGAFHDATATIPAIVRVQ
jgi:hypothetical protein